jgi:hypothetical protein
MTTERQVLIGVVFLLVIQTVSLAFCMMTNSTLKQHVSLLQADLLSCTKDRRPTGAFIQTGNGKKVVITGDGAFKIDAGSIAFIEYTYDHKLGLTR